MDVSPISIITLAILLVLSGFFSSAETALTTVSRIKLRALAGEGNRRAKKILKVTENQGKLLSTILIGNNIVNISASALATTICTNAFGSKYIGVATGMLTLFVLIFGEITPKTIATNYSYQLSCVFVYPIWILMVVLTPVIWVLDIVTGAIFKLLHVDTSGSANAMTETELRAVVNVSHEEGVIEPEEKFMISNVVDFGDALSKDIMIPRADVIFADVNATYSELVEIFKKETYSRLPVYEDTKDNVIGILNIKDLFFYREINDIEYFDLRSILRKPVFVYEYQKTSQIFADMKESASSFAIVLDEYGVTSGIITMEDLVEEIVGEIRDEYDEHEKDFIIEISEKIYDIDASIKLDDLNDAIGISLHSNDYDSLAGFVIEIMDKLPETGEEAIYENIIFKVTRVHKNRIERVILSILDVPELESEEAEYE